MTPVRRGPPPPPHHDAAYFFDIDGTLAEIEADPAQSRVSDPLLRVIDTLRTATGGAVALITGRSIAQADRMFGGVTLPVAGQHGTERRSGDGHVHHHPFAAARMELVRDRVAAAVRTQPRIVVEDKGSSIALHYRQAPRLAAFAHLTARRIASEFGDGLGIQAGKRVVEILAAGQSKGRAVLAFMEELPFRGRRPVFVGDDVTDESAFAVVNALDGVSVKVGDGRTAARWRLANVAQVQRWLESSP